MALDDQTLKGMSPSQFAIVQKIHDEAVRQGVNPELAVAIAEAETGGKFSHYRKDKVLTSPAGARGVMQIMPATAELYNKKFNADIDPDDEDSNIKGGVFIIKDLLTQYKSPRVAVAMYNAGPMGANQFNKLYREDPDKAILSLPKETQDYSLRISKNFNLDDDKQNGFYQAEPSGNEGKKPFVPVADTFPAAKEEEKKEEKPKTPSNVIDPSTGAAIGAGVSALGQIGSKPEYFGPAPDINEIKDLARNKIDVLEESRNKTLASLQEAEGKAVRRNEIAANRLQQRMANPSPVVGGPTISELELEFELSQNNLRGADRELQTRLAEQKAKVPPAPAVTAQKVPQSGSMASATPQIITDPNAPVSRTATEQMMQGTIDPETGTTGRQRQNYNEVTSFQKLQREQQEKALLEASKSGVVSDVGQRARLAFGMPDATPSGILVQPDVAAPLKRQAELEQRIADDKAAQERLAQQQEMQQLKDERALAAQRSNQAQSALTKAQNAQTTGVTRAQTAAETAEDRALAAQQDLESGRQTGQQTFDEARAKAMAQANANVKAAKAAPGPVGRYVANTGVAIGKTGIFNPVGRATIGGIGGLQAARGINELANMDIADLIKRYQAGDRSVDLIAALMQATQATAQTGFGAAAAVPVFGAKSAKIKGAGALGTIGLGGLELYQAAQKRAQQNRDNPR